MSDAPNTGSNAAGDPHPIRLRDALRQARIEATDRTGVVVDLRDAEVARLEILNEALDPLFAQIPEQVDLFDRGLSQGETPRLWIDVVAHVVMGREDRKSTRLNSSHLGISYAVFCLKKKKHTNYANTSEKKKKHIYKNKKQKTNK